jgi:monooxygenase
MPPEHYDVIIIGAGLSGIGAAYHLQSKCPGKSFLILEARATIGGTWDLFRYPGVRSDSDMYTLGYVFRPWAEAKAIADGPSILNYIRETAAHYHITEKILFSTRVTHAEWSSAGASWTLTTEQGAEFTCNFLFTCCGYYNYTAGYTPEFAGAASFAGQIIHPQQWPERLDYAGKRVVVVGSGATAVTLVPAMAETAALVTMLQRSPSYVASLPSADKIADALRRRLPLKFAYALTRWKNVALSMFFFNLARRRPDQFKRRLLGMARHNLGADYDMTHFTPRYNPWDQRLCLIPDGNLFKALKSGKATIITDEISSFTPTGLRLASGTEIAADIVVTATGLSLQLLGGMTLAVDGAPVRPADTLSYKGIMFSGIPNLAFSLGYTNASWTLKTDLTGAFVTRLLAYMDRHNYAYCAPVRGADVADEPLIDFSSGYIQRAAGTLPRQGSRKPWKLYQNYVRDLIALKFGRLQDGTLKFSRR